MESETDSLIVAISGTTGSGAREVGAHVAKALSCRYLDKAIVLAVAEQMKDFAGRLGEQDERLLREAMAPQAIPKQSSQRRAVTESLMLSADDLAFLPTQMALIRAAATWGPLVIVGRAGRWILRDQPALLSVLLHAPLSVRVQRICGMYSLESEVVAEKIVGYCDDRREAFIRRVTGHQTASVEHDVSLDTMKLGITGTLEVALLAVDHFLRQRAWSPGLAAVDPL